MIKTTKSSLLLFMFCSRTSFANYMFGFWLYMKIMIYLDLCIYNCEEDRIIQVVKKTYISNHYISYNFDVSHNSSKIMESWSVLIGFKLIKETCQRQSRPKLHIVRIHLGKLLKDLGRTACLNIYNAS